MAMIRINPMWEMNHLTKEMDRMKNYISNPNNKPRVEFGGLKPRVDVLESDKSIQFEIEIPGVKKDQVSVSVDEENILTIKGEKVFERKDEVKLCCRNERVFGSFTRSFQLPELVDQDNIEANYNNGVLHLTVPKLEPVKPKEHAVEIK